MTVLPCRSLFRERDLSDAQLEPRLESLCLRELLVREGDVVKATEIGRRFLDSVIAEFFPD